jgi:hypothetical protein
MKYGFMDTMYPCSLRKGLGKIAKTEKGVAGIVHH